MQHSNTAGCILLKFYIKPQHTANVYNLLYVVSYRNSTSNHNMSHWRATSQGVVSYRNSTSNHNSRAYPNSLMSLYLIEILHQTTTMYDFYMKDMELYLIEILQQTTTYGRQRVPQKCCILSKFYIKPQLAWPPSLSRYVVSYRNSTSNHNSRPRRTIRSSLYLIEILHQTTTMPLCQVALLRCILSKFYIKPQQRVRHRLGHSVVSYRNSTSNHNNCLYNDIRAALYLIEILHQTTTTTSCARRSRELYLIEILHQTTTR